MTAPTKEHPAADSRAASRRVRRSVIALVASVALHAGLVQSVAVFRRIHLIGDGAAPQFGELGALGSGGQHVEFTIARANAAPREAPPPAPLSPPETPSVPPRAPPPHIAAATATATATATTTATATADDTTRDSSPTETRRAPTRHAPAQVAPPSQTSATATRDPDHAAATTDSGLRAGSVAHQRSLLPRAAQCPDPVAGMWRSHTYFPAWGEWMVATLHIERDGENHLLGRIVAHQWDGGPMSVRPPPCGPDGFEFTVEEPASGRIEGTRIDFGAITYRLRGFACRNGHRGQGFTYNPDTFSGRIDLARNEFQSRLNDGGRAQNEPMVFRRIACTETPTSRLPTALVPE